MMERARSNRSQTFRVTGRDLENAILKKNYSSTSSSQPYDCAIVIEKFLEEFSKQQAKVETKYLEEIKVVTNEIAEVKMKHSEELAKVEKEHFVEVNAVKLELADVKVKHSEKLAEMITLRYDVAEAKTNCSEEVKSMKIELNEAREELSKEVEEKLAEMITLRNDVADSRLETVEEEVSGKLLIQYFGSCYLNNEGYLKALPNINVGSNFELNMTVKPEKLTGILAAIHGSKYDFLHLQLIDGNLILTANDWDGPYNLQSPERILG